MKGYAPLLRNKDTTSIHADHKKPKFIVSVTMFVNAAFLTLKMYRSSQCFQADRTVPVLVPAPNLEPTDVFASKIRTAREPESWFPMGTM